MIYSDEVCGIRIDATIFETRVNDLDYTAEHCRYPLELDARIVVRVLIAVLLVT
jgi:hypothetical protein